MVRLLGTLTIALGTLTLVGDATAGGSSIYQRSNSSYRSRGSSFSQVSRVHGSSYNQVSRTHSSRYSDYGSRNYNSRSSYYSGYGRSTSYGLYNSPYYSSPYQSPSSNSSYGTGYGYGTSSYQSGHSYY